MKSERLGRFKICPVRHFFRAQTGRCDQCMRLAHLYRVQRLDGHEGEYFWEASSGRYCLQCGRSFVMAQQGTDRADRVARDVVRWA